MYGRHNLRRLLFLRILLLMYFMWSNQVTVSSKMKPRSFVSLFLNNVWLIYENCVISIRQWFGKFREMHERSLMYMKNKVGAGIEPCETSTLIDFCFERFPFKPTNCIRSFKYEPMRDSRWPDIPHDFNFTERISWSTQSNAFEKSWRIYLEILEDED